MKNENIIFEQISFSTADDEANYFTGTEQPLSLPGGSEVLLPPGTYRVVNGLLERVDTNR